QYAVAFGNLPLRMVTVPAGRSNDDLFRALDTNRDRVLTSAEWSAAGKLFEKDRDGDRVLTADELRGPTPVAMPPEFVAGVLAQRGLGAPLVIELKAADESPADATVLVNYSENVEHPQLPGVMVRLSPGAAEKGISLENSKSGESVLHVGGRRLVLRVPPPSVRATASLRQQLLEQFDALAESGESRVAAAA